MEYTIITYGSGEVLYNVFNAIAVLINGNSGTIFQPMVRLGLTLGLTWATLAAILGNDAVGFLTRWMVPFYAILNLVFTPTCTLHIKDPASRNPPYTVKNVPLGLGVFAGTISRMSHSITREIEDVFSLPDDIKYHKTGAVLASNLIAESRVFHITNAELQETMKDFVNQCVVYDALIGKKYTVHDLKSSNDIWGLVTRNPSPARSFTFRHPGVGGKTEVCTCKVGAGMLNKYLNQDVQNAFQYFGTKIFGTKDSGDSNTTDQGSLVNPSHELKKFLPISFNYMTNMSRNASDIMRQQMMIYSTVDALEGKSTQLGNAPNFAVRRAYLQQRATKETLSGIAGKTMLAMKNVMEALIYAAFIFILPLAVLPKGWTYIKMWGGLVLWVQLWAPLYAILNFIMNVSARSQGMGLVSLDQGTGVNIANSVGFMNLHADMAAHAGFLSISVPSLAYAIVRGGAASFVHLASHLGGPASQAASRASEDLVSGNYSFGNVSQGVVQAHNSTFGQQQLAPSYSSGSFSQTDGMVGRTTTSDGSHLVNIGNSNLRSSINWSESISNSFSEQASEATQMAENNVKAATQSQAETYRNVIDFSEHQSHQSSNQSGYSQSDSMTENSSLTKLRNSTERFAQDHGISFDKAKQVLSNVSAGAEVNGGLHFLGFGASGKTSSGISKNWSDNETDRELYSKAQDYVKQTGFQDVLNKASTAAHDMRSSDLDDQGKRLTSNINASQDKANQYRTEASVNLSKSESFSKMASHTKQNAASINANYNQELVDWLVKQPLGNSSGPMGRKEAETILASRPEMSAIYQQRFLEELMAKQTQNMSLKGLPQSDHQVSQSFENKSVQAKESGYSKKVQSQANQEGMSKNPELTKNLRSDIKDNIEKREDRLQKAKSDLEDRGGLQVKRINQKVS